LQKDIGDAKALIGPTDRPLGATAGMDAGCNSTDQHRHNSHLFAVHPGKQISPVTIPGWARAAKKSLDARGNISTG